MKMKKILVLLGLIILALCLLVCSTVSAADITLQWDPNTEDDLGGYRVYKSNESDGYTYGIGNEADSISAGTETSTITVEDGNWFFVVTAWDGDGNESERSNEVTLTIDTMSPTIAIPPDQTLEATSVAGAVATFVVTATDTVDPTPMVVCVPASGSTFPRGTTIVTCTAADASGNVSSGSFNIIVVDTTPPAPPQNCFTSAIAR